MGQNEVSDRKDWITRLREAVRSFPRNSQGRIHGSAAFVGGTELAVFAYSYKGEPHIVATQTHIGGLSVGLPDLTPDGARQLAALLIACADDCDAANASNRDPGDEARAA